MLLFLSADVGTDAGSQADQGHRGGHQDQGGKEPAPDGGGEP